MNDANWMLEQVIASLKMYPNGGGDIRVMAEVERIVKESALASPAPLGPLNSKGHWGPCTNPNHNDSQEGPCERQWILDAAAGREK